jgi:1-acyl-sn-glycerol-3-phosphate acyltransferase
MRKAKPLHTILWRLVQMTYGLYLRFNFRTEAKWHAKPPKKGAYVLVANHSNLNDPFIIGVRLRTPINYMANIDDIEGFKKFISTGIGCFSIKKGRADRQAFVKAIQLIKGGYSVGIFPEGDRSWLGETAEFSSATVSLAKKMKVPVLMAKLTGNYLSRPRWSDIPRRGRIFIEYDLISAEQMNQMNKDEIHERIAKFIYNDDLNNEKLSNIRFKGKNLASGIENILWRCPACGLEDKIHGSDNKITCEHCNAEYIIDGNQRITDQEEILSKKNISNTKDWYNWQLEFMKENTGQNILLSDTDVKLIKETSENEWTSLGKGTMTLGNDAIIWKNNKNEENQEFQLSEVMNIVDNFNEYAILNLNNDRYKIIFNKTCSYKWTSYLKIIN